LKGGDGKGRQGREGDGNRKGEGGKEKRGMEREDQDDVRCNNKIYDYTPDH